MAAAGLLSEADQRAVETAVAEAERSTTGEIKVVVLRWCWVPLHVKAVEVFHRLGLDRTSKHNCVLILLVSTNREFIVYGDRGITACVGSAYWFDIRDLMVGHFRAGRIAEGLCAGVRLIGQRLAEHFPANPSDVNEVDDAVVQE